MPRSETKAEFEQGMSATLPDGSTVDAKLVGSALRPVIHVLRNGRHLEGSDGHPSATIRIAGQVLAFLAVTRLVLGGIGLASDALVGGFTLAVGAFNGLGVYGAWRKSRALVTIGVVAFLVESALIVAELFLAPGPTPAVGGLVMRILFGYFLVRAVLQWAPPEPPPAAEIAREFE